MSVPNADPTSGADKPLGDALRRFADAAATAVERDPELAARFATLVRSLLAAGESTGAPAGRHVPAPAAVSGPRVVRTESPSAPARAEGSGGSHREERVAQPFEADLVAVRCRLKARAARWQYEREKLDRDETVRRDGLLIGEARQLPDGYLWMCRADQCRTRAREAMDLLAGAFETVADAAELVGRFDPSDEASIPDEARVQLLAEAQSMLHVMVGRTRVGAGFDGDQMAAFVAAREVGRRTRAFLRYLAVDDAADPEQAPELRARIARLREGEPSEDDEARRLEVKHLSKLRYAAGKLTALGPEVVIDPDDPHLAALAEAVRALEPDDLDEPRPAVVEHLSPLLDRLSELPEGEPFDTLDQVLSRLEDLDGDKSSDASPDPRTADAA
jgi:hypothetical protein